ncbi:Glycerol-3-phosphate O-acyltransferase 2 [Diplonema papillatum]|nr:Glycerol-3-phosphate O-acyltransferase 2 [Diplonema papillatum]
MGESGDAPAPLSPRSLAFAAMTQECLEFHVSEQKIESAKQLIRMPASSERPPFEYRLIRAIFSIVVDVFYHYTEVTGAENLPPPGNAAILCPNHGNSLTDAVVCVSQAPRMVRLTAKDTLFRLPFFGWFVRNVGTVPLQRKDEHEEGVDNTHAVSKLTEELMKGSMVCLFPEGRSRFHWKVDDIKRGVASMAHTCLERAKEMGEDDFTLSLCPTAFNYLHREKFRSGLVVEYGPPLILTPTTPLMSLPRPDAVQKISEKIQQLMALTAFNAEDWNTLRIAHTARNLFAPLGTRMTIVEFVRLTKYWGYALSVNDRKDPSLRDDLTAYQETIERIGLKDMRISRKPDSTVYLLWCMFLRFLQLLILTPPIILGALIWSPTFILCRWYEGKVMKRTKKPTHVDEVAQYKMMIGVVLAPPTAALMTLAVVIVYGLPWYACVWLFPLVAFFKWISIRIIEDGFAGLRSFKSLTTLLFLPTTTLEDLREIRAGLVERVRARARLCGNMKPPMIPEPYRGFWFEFISKFDPRRRRKKDWNEVLRLHEVLPVDYAAIQRSTLSAKKAKAQ